MNKADNLVWIDLEMTGLDPDKERIIEIATLVTDSHLNVLAEGPEMVVAQPESLLAAMDDWNTEHHGKSGLTARVRASQVSEAQAEADTLAFIKAWTEPGKSPLCGNSVGQDRRFLVRYMPQLAAHMNYRNLDVSTIKILAQHWRPDVAAGVTKQNTHRAMDDIRESIAELQHYRAHFFRLS